MNLFIIKERQPRSESKITHKLLTLVEILKTFPLSTLATVVLDGFSDRPFTRDQLNIFCNKLSSEHR